MVGEEALGRPHHPGQRCDAPCQVGVLSIETVTPEGKTLAPSAADEPGFPERSRNRYMPNAASGNGSATHRLNETMSDWKRRIASAHRGSVVD